MAELKPCPFCGGSASVLKVDNTWYEVRCDNCPCNVGRLWFYTRKDATKAWNRRGEDGEYT